jgi:hypothetical protein
VPSANAQKAKWHQIHRVGAFLGLSCIRKRLKFLIQFLEYSVSRIFAYSNAAVWCRCRLSLRGIRASRERERKIVLASCSLSLRSLRKVDGSPERDSQPYS